MLRLRSVALLALLSVVPASAFASDFGRKGSSSKSSGGHGAPAAPSRGYGYQGGGYTQGYYRGGYYYHPGYYAGGAYYGPGYVPYYWGWGIHPWGYYGYGYYPYYGGPVVVDQVRPAPPALTSNVYLGGMFTNDGAGVNLHAGVDGQRWGVNFDLLTLPNKNDTDGTVDAMPLLSGHLTYAVYSDLHAKVRVEGGIAGVGAPDVTYVGPDFGASGQIALVGPLAADASAHWMPVPASIIDLQAGLGLNFGALAVKGSWRYVRLDDTRENSTGGVLTLAGPVLSVGLLF